MHGQRLAEHARRPHTAWEVALLTASTMALGLQATRVFVADLLFVVDQSRRMALALYNLGAFSLPLLAWPLALLIGQRRLAYLGFAVLSIARLALQLTDDAGLRALLGALGIAGWGWLLVTSLSLDRRAAGIGLLAGCVLDLAIRGSRTTVDLPWMPGVASHLATGLLIAAGALALPALRAPASEGSGLPGAKAVLIGPFLVLFHIALGNLGAAQVQAGWTLPGAVLALGLGHTAGIAAGWPLARSGAGWLPGTVVSGIGLWLTWQGTRWAIAGLPLSAVGISSLLAGVFFDGSPGRTRGHIGRVALGLTTGMLLHVTLLFRYYTATGSGVDLALAWLALTLGTAAWWPARPPTGDRRFVLATASAAGIVVALAAAWQAQLPATTVPDAPLPGQLTVMTYNIQSGFALDNRWSLEAIAQTIEEARPDVVVLQEVSRGWLVTNGTDDLLWLSRRLGMRASWGPASADRLWGNAVLTRGPVTALERWRFSRTQNLRRSAIAVRVETDRGPVWIIGTHLDDPRGAGAVRLAQVEELLAFWARRTPAVIAGDFNAEPGDPVIARVLAERLIDAGAVAGLDTPTSEDGRRIDYVLVTPDLTVIDAHVLDRWSSDHRPVVVRLTMP